MQGYFVDAKLKGYFVDAKPMLRDDHHLSDLDFSAFLGNQEQPETR